MTKDLKLHDESPLLPEMQEKIDAIPGVVEAILGTEADDMHDSDRLHLELRQALLMEILTDAVLTNQPVDIRSKKAIFVDLVRHFDGLQRNQELNKLKRTGTIVKNVGLGKMLNKIIYNEGNMMRLLEQHDVEEGVEGLRFLISDRLEVIRYFEGPFLPSFNGRRELGMQAQELRQQIPQLVSDFNVLASEVPPPSAD